MTVDPTGRGIARPVVRIAEGGVAIGVALIILSLAIVQGFQRDVRELVVGFGAHLRVVAGDQGRTQGTDRVAWADVDTARLRAIEGVEQVQAFAQRPAILETAEEVEGVVVKGLGADVDTAFLAQRLLAGRLPDFGPDSDSLDVLVSSIHARELGLEPGRRVRLLLANAKGEMRPRVFTVCGVYGTGLQEFDAEYVFCGIHHLQQLSGWGITARLQVRTGWSRICPEFVMSRSRPLVGGAVSSTSGKERIGVVPAHTRWKAVELPDSWSAMGERPSRIRRGSSG